MEDDYENGRPVVPVKILQVFQEEAGNKEYKLVNIMTPRGKVTMQYYSLPGATVASVLVGGIGGNFDTPARLLYPKLGTELLNEGFVTLRIQFRDPHNLDESVYDVATGLTFLHTESIGSVGLVGHSFGGAVVIRAASLDTSVSAVVTLASQSYGAGGASDLGPRCALLLIHGSRDSILPQIASEHIFALAKEPKRISIYQSASHNLDEAAEEVYEEVKEWLVHWVRDRT